MIFYRPLFMPIAFNICTYIPGRLLASITTHHPATPQIQFLIFSALLTYLLTYLLTLVNPPLPHTLCPPQL